MSNDPTKVGTVDKIEHEKTPWSAEKSAFLAQQEARFTLDGVKFVNRSCPCSLAGHLNL